jgi:hypothetical protein
MLAASMVSERYEIGGGIVEFFELEVDEAGDSRILSPRPLHLPGAASATPSAAKFLLACKCRYGCTGIAKALGTSDRREAEQLCRIA